MITKLLTSFLLVGLASAAMGYTTYAYFSDTEEVGDVALVSGTLDLATTAPSTVRAALGASDFAPGDTTAGSILLTNTGSISNGVLLDWGLDVATTDAQGGATSIASFIEVTKLSYGGDDYLARQDGGEAVADSNRNGWIDLDDVAADGPFTAKNDPGAAGTAMDIALRFHPTAGNALQGDAASLSFTYFLRQAGEPALQ